MQKSQSLKNCTFSGDTIQMIADENMASAFSNTNNNITLDLNGEKIIYFGTQAINIGGNSDVGN